MNHSCLCYFAILSAESYLLISCFVINSSLFPLSGLSMLKKSYIIGFLTFLKTRFAGWSWITLVLLKLRLCIVNLTILFFHFIHNFFVISLKLKNLTYLTGFMLCIDTVDVFHKPSLVSDYKIGTVTPDN